MPASDHNLVEQRSLRYHAAIAARLSTDDAILERARGRVEAWISQGTVAPYYAAGWQRVLLRPVCEITAFLTQESEEARAFRQVSPFAGALTPRERWRLWAAVKHGHDTTAT